MLTDPGASISSNSDMSRDTRSQISRRMQHFNMFLHTSVTVVSAPFLPLSPFPPTVAVPASSSRPTRCSFDRRKRITTRHPPLHAGFLTWP